MHRKYITAMLQCIENLTVPMTEAFTHFTTFYITQMKIIEKKTTEKR